MVETARDLRTGFDVVSLVMNMVTHLLYTTLLFYVDVTLKYYIR